MSDWPVRVGTGKECSYEDITASGVKAWAGEEVVVTLANGKRIAVYFKADQWFVRNCGHTEVRTLPAFRDVRYVLKKAALQINDLF